LAHLTTQLDEFFAFRIAHAARSFFPAAFAATSLGNPIANGLRCWFEFTRQVVRIASGTDQVTHLAPKLRRIGWAGLGHSNTPLTKASGCPPRRVNPTKSHSRPHTSNDNPFSEAHFKTLKYQPQFPKRFGCIEDARTFCRRFFTWYNQDHHHVGIGLMTPDQVHYGQANAVHAARQDVLAQAYQANPERFVRKAPVPPSMPIQTWINPPRKTDINQA
jgi:hypothetical protein